MDTLSYKTVSVNKATAQKEWVVIDAQDQILGRMCSKVAKLLRGKYKPSYTPNVDCGDNVIVINAEKVQLTGKKWSDRTLFSYSGYPGGRHDKTPAQIMAKYPTRLLEHTIKGMLPKTRLGAQLFRNLHVYTGAEHKHEAQQPKLIDIKSMK